jgi:hypothetical protein
MSYKEDLEQLTTCGDIWAEERAKLAQGLIKSFESGSIDQSEYQELMQDLIRTDALDESATSVEIKSMFVGAIMLGAQLV